MNALEKSWREGNDKHHSELMTLYINENQSKFKIYTEEAPTDLQRDYRLTVDTPKDLELMRTIYMALYKGDVVPLREALRFLDNHPKIAQINKEIPVGTSKIW